MRVYPFTHVCWTCVLLHVLSGMLFLDLHQFWRKYVWHVLYGLGLLRLCAAGVCVCAYRYVRDSICCLICLDVGNLNLVASASRTEAGLSWSCSARGDLGPSQFLFVGIHLRFTLGEPTPNCFPALSPRPPRRYLHT